MEPKPSPLLLGIIRAIDAFTWWTGHLFILLLIPLILANVVEVFSRYVMNDPTIWALDLTTMSFGALFMLGCGLTLLKGAHVRTDMLWDKFSDRTKGTIDSIAFIVFFLPTMAILFYVSYGSFQDAFRIGERSNSGAWAPIIWPLRGVVPLTFALLFVQGVSELLKSLWAARTGKFLVEHEKIEI